VEITRGVAQPSARCNSPLKNDNAATATQNAADAKAQEKLASRRLYAAQINMAQQAWEKGNPGRVMELLENRRPKFDEEDLRTFEWYYLWRLCHRQRQCTLQHTGVMCVAVSPDGKMLASGSSDSSVKVWDLATRRELASLRGRGHWCVFSVAFSPDGMTLAAGVADGTTTLWDIPTGRDKATFNSGAGIRAVAFSPDGKTLAAGGYKYSRGIAGGVVKLWDLATGQERVTLDGHAEAVLSVAFSPDSRMLASSSEWTSEVKLWDLTSEPPQVARAWSATGPVAFFPDGKTIAAGAAGRVGLWDVATGEERVGSPQGLEMVVSIAVSPDGKTLAIGCRDRTLRLWEPATGWQSIIGHAHSVGSVAFTPDGKTVASASGDRITQWDAGHHESQEISLQGYAGGRNSSVAYSPNGKTLAYAATNAVVKLCDPVMYESENRSLKLSFTCGTPLSF
jgi:WD40 repeat protein